MGDRRPPDGYVEIDRWTINQASLKEILLLVFVGLVALFASLAAAGVKGIHKTYHCGGGIVYHRRDEREPYGTWSGDCLVAREESSGVS